MNREYAIYAVDFDGTLCESEFPGIGAPNIFLINHLIKRRKQGDSRKIHADVFIDDKAVNKPKYHVPYKECKV